MPIQIEDEVASTADPTDVVIVRRGTAGAYTIEVVLLSDIGGGGGSATWGGIAGTLSAQTDLQAALNAKEDAGTAATAVAAHVAALDPHTQYALESSLGTLATQNGTFSGTSSGTNTGDQTITLTGDVTGTGTGSFTTTIAAEAVTYTKMQTTSLGNVVLGKSGVAGTVTEIQLGLNNLLGRGSSGNLTTITLDTTLGFTGAVLGVLGKQDTLVSGTNIKTVNGNSLLGAGDLVVSGGGSTSWGPILAAQQNLMRF